VRFGAADIEGGDGEDICSLSPYVDEESAEGCRGRFEMWTHNATAGKCELFFWNGCGASANVFDGLELCREKCPDVERVEELARRETILER